MREAKKKWLEKVNLHIETYVRRSFSGIGIHVLHFMPCGVHEEFFFRYLFVYLYHTYKCIHHSRNNKHCNAVPINNRQNDNNESNLLLYLTILLV